MINKYMLLGCSWLILLLAGCDLNDDNGTERSPEADVFILNEGSSSASVTGYNFATEEVSLELFNQVNDRLLGDFGQSFNVIDNELFIVMNGSNRIEVVDPLTLEMLHGIEIPEEPGPRHISQISEDRALVTTTFNSSVAIIDLENYEHEGWIETGETQEELVTSGSRALIHQSYFDDETFETDNWIIRFDWQEEQVLDTLSFDGEPMSIKAAENGTAWVMIPDLENPYLSLRDVESGSELERIDLPEVPSDLAVDEVGGHIYATSTSGIMKINTETGEVEDASLIEAEGLSSIGFDHPGREYLLSGTNPDYETSDDVYIYTTEGEAVDTFTAGIKPHQFYFPDAE